MRCVSWWDVSVGQWVPALARSGWNPAHPPSLSGWRDALERYTFTAMGEHTDATTVLSFRVPTEDAERVRALATLRGMKVNKALRLWLHESLAKKEND